MSGFRNGLTPENKNKLSNDGAIPVGNSPEEFGAFIKRELDKWAKVVKAAGITPE